MIVDTMSLKQICDEYRKIEKEFKPKCERLLSEGSDRYRMIYRYMVKHKSQETQYFKPLTCRVDVNTTYHCVPMSMGYKLFKKYGLLSIRYITFHYNNRLWAMQRRGLDSKLFFIYTTHFMNRYNERILNSTATSEEALLHCIKNNTSASFTQAHRNEDKYDMIGVSDCCVSFAKAMEGNIVLMKTCISPDMLYKNQTRKTDVLAQSVQQINLMHQNLKKAMKQSDQQAIQYYINEYENANFNLEKVTK